MGPKLLPLYINDICNVSSDIKYIHYADDTSILCSSNNIRKLFNTMNKNLQELQIWFTVNKISLSIETTNHMILLDHLEGSHYLYFKQIVQKYCNNSWGWPCP